MRRIPSVCSRVPASGGIRPFFTRLSKCSRVKQIRVLRWYFCSASQSSSKGSPFSASSAAFRSSRIITPEVARELAKEEHLLFLCGHYEGIDERVSCAMDEELSIGDYVLTGGELAAMVAIDCIARFIPGVLGSSESAETESFSDGLLEYPQYTRPAEFRGMKVPEVLLNGNHALIERWRRDRAIELTLSRRPELMEHVELNKKDIAFIQSIKKDEKAR